MSHHVPAALLRSDDEVPSRGRISTASSRKAMKLKSPRHSREETVRRIRNFIHSDDHDENDNNHPCKTDPEESDTSSIKVNKNTLDSHPVPNNKDDQKQQSPTLKVSKEREEEDGTSGKSDQVTASPSHHEDECRENDEGGKSTVGSPRNDPHRDSPDVRHIMRRMRNDLQNRAATIRRIRSFVHVQTKTAKEFLAPSSVVVSQSTTGDAKRELADDTRESDSSIDDAAREPTEDPRDTGLEVRDPCEDDNRHKQPLCPNIVSPPNIVSHLNRNSDAERSSLANKNQNEEGSESNAALGIMLRARSKRLDRLELFSLSSETPKTDSLEEESYNDQRQEEQGQDNRSNRDSKSVHQEDAEEADRLAYMLQVRRKRCQRERSRVESCQARKGNNNDFANTNDTTEERDHSCRSNYYQSQKSPSANLDVSSSGSSYSLETILEDQMVCKSPCKWNDSDDGNASRTSPTMSSTNSSSLMVNPSLEEEFSLPWNLSDICEDDNGHNKSPTSPTSYFLKAMMLYHSPVPMLAECTQEEDSNLLDSCYEASLDYHYFHQTRSSKHPLPTLKECIEEDNNLLDSCYEASLDYHYQNQSNREQPDHNRQLDSCFETSLDYRYDRKSTQRKPDKDRYFSDLMFDDESLYRHDSK